MPTVPTNPALIELCLAKDRGLLKGKPDHKAKGSGKTTIGIAVSDKTSTPSPYLLLALVFCVSPLPSALGQTGGHCRREFWVVNTRNAPSCQVTESGFDCLRYFQYLPNGQMRRASLAELLVPDRPMPVIYYVHGNGHSENMALRGGRQVYDALCRYTSASFRFVLWSWPADTPTRGLFNGFRVHAVQADRQGYYLARLVGQTPPTSQPIGLAGHSLGGITIAAALHYLAGGSIDGRRLSSPTAPELLHLRCAHIASAMDNDAMLPGRRYGMSFRAGERVLIFRNPRDRILPFWERRISPRGVPAVSLYGLACPSQLGPDRHKLEQFTTTSYLRRRHFYPPHYRSPEVVSRLVHLFFAPPTSPAQDL